MTRRTLYLAMTMLAAGCTPTGVDAVTSSSWAGDITVTDNMLIMTVAERGTTLSGSGGFSALTVAGSVDPFTLSGTRRADTLDLILKRRTGSPVHFVGWLQFGHRVLVGNLTGGEFHGTPVTLVKQH